MHVEPEKKDENLLQKNIPSLFEILTSSEVKNEGPTFHKRTIPVEKASPPKDDILKSKSIEEKYRKIRGLLIYNDFSDETVDLFIKILIHRGSIPETWFNIADILRHLKKDIYLENFDDLCKEISIILRYLK